MKKLPYLATILFISLTVFSCQSDQNADLKEALTFYSSFDQGTEADFALGDATLYSAPTRKQQTEAMEGIDNDIHRIVKGEGLQGGALRFMKGSPRVAFYKSKDNVAYDPAGWSGTISFWLRVDPVNELEPGYTDPIQITDKAYDDAAIWVDFTRDEPRQFRLGILGDVVSWEQDTVKTSAKIEFEKRLVVVDQLPFSKEHWTHVAITHEALGTAQSTYTLYLDGNKMGTLSGFDDPFGWELENSNIFLGLSFVGMIDELSIYNKPFTQEQVQRLFGIKAGIKSIL